MTFAEIEQEWSICSTRQLRRFLWEKLTGINTRGWFQACRNAVQAVDCTTLLAWRNEDDTTKQDVIQLGSRFGFEEAACMVRAHLHCALTAVEHQQWTSGTVPSDVLQAIADKLQTPPPIGFLRDLTAELLDAPPRQPVREPLSLTALLVDTALDKGIVANLTLELMPDGNKNLYPTPALAFVVRDKDFSQAEENARTCVQREGLWQEGWDVRWRLERRDQTPITALTGNSAGLAFALGLAKLLIDDGT
jgi:hypothetical protein